MTIEEELIDVLFKLNLIYYSGKSEYFIDSNTKAPFFFDINSVNSFPFFREKILTSLVNLIKKITSHTAKKAIGLIAASGHSGIPFAALIAEKTGLPMVYIRDSSKKHGKKNMIEGSIKEGAESLLFTEILSSESKIENSVKALNEKGSSLKGVITIIDMLDYDEIKIDNNIFSVYSIIKLKDIIEYARKNKSLNNKVIELMENWSSNKQNYSSNCCNNSDFSDAALNTIASSVCDKLEQDNAQEAAETLLDIKAVILSLKEPFRYTSGILSPIYCDNRLLISNPEKWNIIINIMEDIIKTRIGIENIEVIAGTSTAGIPHAAKIAEKFSLPLVYVKSDKGEIGKKSNIEGSLFYGKRVLVIEDLVSTGKSSIESVKLLREHGAIVDYCIAIFTYQIKSAEKIFADEKCLLFTASNFKTFIKTAVDRKYIIEEEAEKAIAWNSDPENWGKKYGYEQ